MATTINAGNATSGAAISADTTGILTLQSGSTPTTAVTIDASQNVGIGTSTPTNKLSIQGGLNTTDATVNTVLTQNGSVTIFGTSTNHPLTFWTNAGEKMRIDSSGNLLVGKTTYVASSAGLQVPPGNSAMVYNNQSTSTSSDGLFACWSNNSTSQEKFIVRANGDCNNRTGVYSSYSDIRLKDNITDARSYVKDLCKLRVVNYSFISDAEKTKYLGFIAQEVEEVMPNLVAVSPTEELPDAKTIKLTVMIPMLVQAIQELNAKVEALEAQLGAK